MTGDTFTSALLDWYARNGRDLPWRHTSDPYPIWLSEVILQQTRIAQGTQYWERFMERFPTVKSLAAASEDEVLRLWQGLGYYSRARNLHAAAKQIVAMGGFPTSYEEIRQLKGVGDYTAAAIASFAFGLPYAAIDGNAYRVLARYYGITTPINTTAAKKEFTALAQQLLPPSRAADFNQAMMDFGATLCTPTSPRCSECPLAEGCDALHTHRTDVLPVKEKTVKMATRHFTFIYIRCQGETAIMRRPAGDIWQGLWQPPLIEGEKEGTIVLPVLTRNGQLTLLAQGVKHVLTHRIIYADFYLLDTSVKPTLPDGYIWIPENQLDRYALPRLVERLLNKLTS
ncbi:MAG: A/G-specific adenine glycosylase [Muribaculaceae bacterium]|nr:A/G-specific adenine glycosylase [Muribaculaceae bacterium]